MPLPGKLDLAIYQGDSFEREFLVEQDIDGVNEPVDFTGHNVAGFVRTHQSSRKVISVFDISWPVDDDGEDELEDRTLGSFYGHLSASQTANLPLDCVYDIKSVDPIDGYTKTWVYGRIRVIRGVTRD
jgi:hypothetical protein